MLVRTISSQSRQETPVSKTDSNQHQDNEIPSIPAEGFILFILFILLTGAMITPGILSPNPQNTLSFIALVVDIIIFFRLTTYLTNKNSLSIIVKKWVHYTQQCRVEVSRVIHSILQHKWLIKTFAIALSFPVSLTLTGHWKEVAGKITAILEFFIIDNKSLGISILITFIFALIIFHKNIITTFQKFISGLTSKYFIFTLASLAIIGALSALSIPSYTSWFREPGYTSAQQDSAKETPEKVQETPASTPSPTGNKAAEVEQKSTSDLRLHFLYITGGVIAILGLIETNRKNSQDHIRQVHAARRERYIEAVDKLASEQAPVRLGGVYALSGLIDEWLDDDNIDKDIRVKEGQVIINNLCSYIRSAFPLAQKADTLELKDKDPSYGEGISGKGFFADQATFREEQNVRQTIFIEMDKRSSTVRKDEEGKITVAPGTWSDFDFDFSRAPIFYSLNNLTIEKGNFSEANFYGNQNFKNVKFAQDADFSGAEFNKFATDFKVKFSSVIFAQKAIFSDSTFENEADFLSATFGGRAEFNGTIFKDDAIFSAATFTGFASFSASFMGEAKFSQVTFKSATFSGANFDRNASFSGKTTFGGIVNFRGTPFSKDVFFDEVTFEDEVFFSSAVFTQKARFLKATFAQKADFSYATFENYEPLFASGEERAKFSVRPSQEDYIFSVSSGSKPIHTRETKLDDVTRRIPIGTVLFDPSSPKDENGKYRESPPA
jgi:uncharacterized low-complexity protein